jgi:hypothetical protein
VEFALVVPVLITLVFGLIDFGLWFSNSLAANTGVREGARQGIVQNYGSCQELRCLADLTKSRTTTVAGTQFVKILAPGGWRRGADLVVCTQIQAGGLTGFTPLPSDGVIATSVTMRIEQDDMPPDDYDGTPYADPGAPVPWAGPCAG